MSIYLHVTHSVVYFPCVNILHFKLANWSWVAHGPNLPSRRLRPAWKNVLTLADAAPHVQNKDSRPGHKIKIRSDLDDFGDKGYKEATFSPHRRLCEMMALAFPST